MNETNSVKNPGRREFLHSMGKASLGLAAAAGMGAAPLSGSEGKPAPLGKPDPLERPDPVLDPQAPLNIGMIGRTGHTYEVFRHLDEIPGARITAHAFEDGDWEFNCDGTGRGAGKQYDMGPMRKWAEGQEWFGAHTSLYETYQEMLDKEKKLDLVVVCLPYARNPFAASAAARRGIHIFSEKPVAVNYPDLEMLETALSQGRARLSAMFGMRTSPTIAAIRRGVTDGLVGRPILGRAQKSYRFGAERPWFYKHREIYGGTILWAGIHALDFVRWTMGLEVVKVAAMHGNLAHPGYPGCQDSSVVMMELEGGAQASVTADYLRPAQAPTHGDDRLRVIGSGGVLETRDLNSRVELITHGQGPKDVQLPVKKISLFADFAGSLRGLNAHLIGPDEAVRVTRIAIAATEAADTGVFVRV
ncbi:MAG: Gfo/Idh/MocA family oxidoreductase [Gemmatimonadota bacterium]|nr:Gfo/Idh/MocA family oxidoreductase [Gemmatimonadota bacterium]